MTDARFADAWEAAEWLVSPAVERRRRGLAALTASDRLGSSPLLLHLLVSRLAEPDLELRCSIVVNLARCLYPTSTITPGLQAAREQLAELLKGCDRKHVEWLLEADIGPAETDRYRRVQRPALILLDRVPNLGGTLTRIAADRSAPMPTRAAAARALGELGVVEALPALEGLKTRIAGQSAGQVAMAFAPRSEPGEQQLLEALKSSIEMLLDDE